MAASSTPPLAVGDYVRYVGGGRFTGKQVFDNHFELLVGQVGFIHAVPGTHGEIGCTFGGRLDGRTCKVSLNCADVMQLAAEPERLGGGGRRAPSSSRIQRLPRQAAQRLPLPPLVSQEARLRRADSAPNVTARYGSMGGCSDRDGTPKSAATISNQPMDLKTLSARGQASFDSLPQWCGSPSGRPPASARGDEQDDEVCSPESAQSQDRPHPPSFYCPISRQCMHDPVVLTDGHTYERRYIEQWLEHSNTSPVSGAVLTKKAIFPNHALRNAIEEYFEEVLSGHRKAVRQVTSTLMQRQRQFSCSSTLLRTVDSMMQCAVLVNADLSTEVVLKRIMEEAKTLVGAEVASVFLLDRKRRELYSTVNSTGGELRIPFKSGVAGFVASTGMPLIIQNAYEDSRFNAEVDDKTGFRTRNILCVPIRAMGSNIGVAQLINKIPGGVLAASDDPSGPELDFTPDDQKFFEVLASQAGAALAQQGWFMPERLQPPMEHPASPMRAHTPQSPQASHKKSSSSSSSLSSPSNAGPSSRASEASASASASATATPPLPAEALEPSLAARCAMRPLLKAAWGSWEMDTLTLSELSNNAPLSTLALYLIEQHGLIKEFSLDRSRLARFLVVIEAGYPETNHYHNRAHAASVLHFMHALLLHGGIAEATSIAADAAEENARRPRLVMLAGLLAAVVHDFEHEGVSNDFLVKSANPKAIMYNDRSPNEQHHAAAAFRLLLEPEYNFLESMGEAEFRQLRSLIVDMVLATDMAENGRIQQAFKDMIDKMGATGSDGVGAGTFSATSASEASLALKMALKCADVGHLALSWSSHLRWTSRLEKEFFSQGDMEKQLRWASVSFLMDREKPGVSQTQLGFFNFVVLPLFRSLGQAFPDACPMVSAVEANHQRWSEVQAEIEAFA